MKQVLYASIFLLALYSCKKEEEAPPEFIPNYPPLVSIIQPDTNGISSDLAEIPIDLEARDDQWVEYMEVRLYRIDDADTIPIYLHWEKGAGNSCNINKRIREKVSLDRQYKIKVVSADSSGQETEINANFFLLKQ